MKRLPVNNMLDEVKTRLRAKNDAALARKLGVTPGAITRLRKGNNALGPAMLVKIHDATGMAIETIRRLAT